MNERSDCVAVSVNGLGKFYASYKTPVDRLKKLIIGESFTESGHWALRGVSMQVRQGETVGIVGRNGSGKSTLLQVVAGTLYPTEGTCATHGRVAALLELGAGFNADFTGRENIFLNAAILGMGRDETRVKYAEIVDFSELGDAIDQPVKTYSSGMVVRLAFSVAISVDPNIFIIDEALSVGDEAFQRKCFSKIEQIKNSGATIIFVSHSSGAVIELCDRAFFLDRGQLLSSGEPKKVVGLYQKLMFSSPERAKTLREAIISGDESALQEESFDGVAAGSAENIDADNDDECDDVDAYYDPDMSPRSTVKYEDHGAAISGVRVETLSGRVVNSLTPGRRYRYRYTVTFSSDARNVRFGMMIKTVSGFELAGAATSATHDLISNVTSGAIFDVEFEFDALMAPGFYFLNAGVVEQEGKGINYLNRMLDVAMFRVQEDVARISTGQVNLNVAVRCRSLANT